MINTEFLESLYSQPWLMQPEKLHALVHRVARAMTGDETEQEAQEAIEKLAASRGRGSGGKADQPSIAVIPIRGCMAPNDSWWGTIGTRSIRKAVLEATADENVKGIILPIDSPGGSVYGTPELADAVFEAKASKPVIALADNLAASAAYWVGSQASKFYATPSGDVGSIGVWMAHADLSKALEKAGITVTLIRAGKFKAEGNPWEPLGKDAQKALQESVDDTYQDFVAAVARGRGASEKDVISNMGGGRVVSSNKAITAGMIDGIATFEQVVEAMQQEISTADPGRSRADVDPTGGAGVPSTEIQEPKDPTTDTNAEPFRGSIEWRKRKIGILTT